MTRRDLKKALGERARLLESLRTDQSRQRVWERVQSTVHERRRGRHGNPGRYRLAWAFALAAVACIALVFLTTRERWGRSSPSTPSEIEGFAISDARGLDFKREGDDVIVTAGQAQLVSGDMSLSVETGTRLRRDSKGVRLVRGKATFVVRHRPLTEQPARVLVDGGAIEVMGTRFRVLARQDDGEVTLDEGAIRFVASDGSVTKLAPGQSYHWSAPTPDRTAIEDRPAAPTETLSSPYRPTPSRPSKQAKRPARERLDVDTLLAEVAELRDRRQYQEAARLLDDALEASIPQATRERLSYELGTILSNQLDDRERACRHWSEHERLFPAGRYAREVSVLRSRLSCAEEH